MMTTKTLFFNSIGTLIDENKIDIESYVLNLKMSHKILSFFIIINRPIILRSPDTSMSVLRVAHARRCAYEKIRD